MNKNAISIQDVSVFKKKYCNENEIIIKLLNETCQEYLLSPIVDVGAGMGDIAYSTMRDKDAILIDINHVDEKYPFHQNHIRQHCDFFHFSPQKKINTVFISHALQFLDDDISLLNNKISELDPQFLILIVNQNNDFMGIILSWINSNGLSCNAEVRIDGFPIGFQEIKSTAFTAKLKCPNYPILAEQISYLMLCNFSNIEHALIAFLKTNLPEPEFLINQSIKVYKKHGK